MRENTNPAKESEEIKRALDYAVGDIVQITRGKGRGHCGVIVGIGVRMSEDGNSEKDRLIYNLQMSNKLGVQADAHKFKLIRHADDAEFERMTK